MNKKASFWQEHIEFYNLAGKAKRPTAPSISLRTPHSTTGDANFLIP